MLTKDRSEQTPRYFRGIAVIFYTVPIVEKFVERAKADREPTQGHRPYRTAKTALDDEETSDFSFNLSQFQAADMSV